MRKTPAAQGIHSQTPTAPAVPNKLGSRKKIIVRINQAAVPLVGKAGDRNARGKMRVDEHDEEDSGRAGDPQPDAYRTGGSEQARQQEEDRRGDADHREGDGERSVRSEGAPERLAIAKLMEVTHVVRV